MKVFVYYNLHKHCWSIKNVKTGLVIAHTNTVQLKDVTFKVSEAGRQRVLKEKRKNVHAGVVGELINKDFFFVPVNNDSVSYNPYKSSTFFNTNDNSPIYKAEGVIMANRKIWR